MIGRISTIRQGAHLLRPMHMGDAQRILGWRNRPAIRQSMFTTGEITLEGHLAWMESTIASEAVYAFIYEADDRPLGYVKLDDKGDGAWNWGFYIGEPDAPKGAGSRMLFLALEYAFTQLGATCVLAEVKPSNTPSIRVHERLGFQQQCASGTENIHYFIASPAWQARRAELAAPLFGGEN